MAKRQLWIGKFRNWANDIIVSFSFEEEYNDFDDGIPAPDFERITGLKLKLGEVRKIKKITIELEPK